MAYVLPGWWSVFTAYYDRVTTNVMMNSKSLICLLHNVTISDRVAVTL